MTRPAITKPSHPFVGFTLIVILFLVSCGQNTPPANKVEGVTPISISTTTNQPTRIATTTPDVPQETALTRPYSYTYQQPDGNRVVAGHGNLSNLQPIDISLTGTPQWVTAVPLAKGVLWGVILADGRTQAFLVDTGNVTTIDSNVLPPGVARSMTVDPQQGQALFLNPPASDPTSTNPVIYNDAGHMATSDVNGALHLVDGNGLTLDHPEVTLLPDARILFDENGRLLFLSDPTDAYAHGVLGDPWEAGSITLLETTPERRIITHIPISAPQVIEGIMPLWVDWNGDGVREIIVTLSDNSQGAQINLFSETGALLAQGPAVGQGNRWRHQIALAPFGPNAELELVDVLTPHIGGIVEFYQWHGDTLQIVAQVSGYTSHIIGTNNLDMAMAGDFNGDGRVELLLPTQSRTHLGGIQRTLAGADVVYQLDLEGQVITNLAGVTLSGGETAVGLGRADNTLRIWQP